jgi:hypothetical protein
MNPDASVKPKAPQPAGIRSPESPSPPAARAEIPSANTRLIRIVSILLFLQITLLVVISVWLLQGIDWDNKSATMMFSQSDTDALGASIWFLFSVILLLPAAIGLLFLRRYAWLMAMGAQILLLALTLIVYFRGTAPTLERAYRIFAVMGSAVVLVFYLNLSGVRTVIYWRRDEEG